MITYQSNCLKCQWMNDWSSQFIFLCSESDPFDSKATNEVTLNELANSQPPLQHLHTAIRCMAEDVNKTRAFPFIFFLRYANRFYALNAIRSIFCWQNNLHATRYVFVNVDVACVRYSSASIPCVKPLWFWLTPPYIETLNLYPNAPIYLNPFFSCFDSHSIGVHSVKIQISNMFFKWFSKISLFAQIHKFFSNNFSFQSKKNLICGCRLNGTFCTFWMRPMLLKF